VRTGYIQNSRFNSSAALRTSIQDPSGLKAALNIISEQLLISNHELHPTSSTIFIATSDLAGDGVDFLSGRISNVSLDALGRVWVTQHNSTSTFTKSELENKYGVSMGSNVELISDEEGLFGLLRDTAETIQEFAITIARVVKTKILAASQIFVKTIIIVPGGNALVPEGENQIAGEGIIKAGETTVEISNNQITETSKIIATPTTIIDLPLVITKRVAKEGFIVEIARPQDQDIAFSWLLINTYKVGSPRTTNIEDSTVVNQDNK